MPSLREYASLISAATNHPLPTHATRSTLLAHIETVHRSSLFVPVRSTVSASKVDMCTIGQSIVREFDRIIASYDMAEFTVLIENQIGPIAMRMKTIQGMLMQYFLMRGATDIRFVSSSNKLTAATQPSPDSEVESATDTTVTPITTYTGRKKESVARAKQHIKGCDWEQWFDQHSKQDDLADALLQALWFRSMRKRT